MGVHARRKRAAEQGQRVARHYAVLEGGGWPDLDDLHALTDGDDPVIAARAALVLLRATYRLDRRAFEAELPRIVRVAGLPDLPPQQSSLVLAETVWRLCTAMLIDFSRAYERPDKDTLAAVAELAELSVARDPASVWARCTLAFARCMADRDAEARELLIAEPLDRLWPEVRVRLLTVRALAELQLHEVAQARSLVEQARRDRRDEPLLTLVGRLVEATEARLARGPSPD